MDLTDEELLVTKHKRKLISYTKQVASGKLDKNFYNAYCELYDLLCEYMDRYNEAEQELEYHKKLLIHIIDDILLNMGLEINEKNEARTIQTYKDNLRKVENKVDLDRYEITIPLKDTGLEDIEYYYKKGDKWYAHYKETQVDKTKVKELEEQAKSKVTEKELKDMIIGMLE